MPSQDRYEGFREFAVARGAALSRVAYLLTGDHQTAEDLRRRYAQVPLSSTADPATGADMAGLPSSVRQFTIVGGSAVNDPTLTAYRELDAEARDYADPDRALAVARRRRRNRLTATAVVAPLLAGALAAGVAAWPSGDPQPPAYVVSVSAPGLLQAPAKPKPLPAGAVRPAVLAYAPCFSGCPAPGSGLVGGPPDQRRRLVRRLGETAALRGAAGGRRRHLHHARRGHRHGDEAAGACG